MPRNYIKPVLGSSFLVLAFFLSFGFQNRTFNTSHYPLETPMLEQGDVFVKHTGYAFVYNECYNGTMLCYLCNINYLRHYMGNIFNERNDIFNCIYYLIYD